MTSWTAGDLSYGSDEERSSGCSVAFFYMRQSSSVMDRSITTDPSRTGHSKHPNGARTPSGLQPVYHNAASTHLASWRWKKLGNPDRPS
ncbi:hypothetical protein RRG08_018238 [Elysia crispata]|uniref:Uncharacterized protein n=1 Tax=Elysia crispata TaxID=231223 RepID=A0AAE0YL23_9GAST|nr:hypothetical protein RRG08_018238 [Elysia crispata]